jgi:hypothetical protein
MDRVYSERQRVPVCARLTFGSVLACITAVASARAEPAPALFARPMGGWTSGGSSAGGPIGGALAAVELGWATLLPGGGDPAHGGLTLGARAGWQFANGLGVHLRYDELGVEPSFLSSPLQLATAGLRYSVPFLDPLPFAEVQAGPAFVGGDVTFGAGAGLGVSVPVGRHVLVDAVIRDWLVSIAGELRQTLTANLGLTVTFASPSR